MKRSPCFDCPRLNEDKRECSEFCEDLKAFQKFLEETHTNDSPGINPVEDTFSIEGEAI